MSAPRTVTVQTADHGPVTIPEPSWCAGAHPAGGYRSDINHQGQPVTAFVETDFHGQVPLVEARLTQWPFSIRSRVPYMAVEMDAGQHEYDQAGLEHLAHSMVAFALYTMPQLRTALAAAIEEARQ